VTLSARVSESSVPAWEVLEQVTPDGLGAVVFAFQNDGGAESTRVVLRRLSPDAVYRVESVDLGSLGAYQGRTLMSDGFELRGSPNTAAHVVLVSPLGSDATAVKKRR
jgi:hypothetical protein